MEAIKEMKVHMLRREGQGIVKIAKELGLGVGTVKRIVDAHRPFPQT